MEILPISQKEKVAELNKSNKNILIERSNLSTVNAKKRKSKKCLI